MTAKAGFFVLLRLSLSEWENQLFKLFNLSVRVIYMRGGCLIFDGTT